MKSVCVYLGSSYGDSPIFDKAAAQTGRLLAENGLTLVFGGSNVGLMKTLADAALAAGGRVVGVTINRFVELGVDHQDLAELHVVEDMHVRKALMRDLAEAFIALPGGLGTFEELLETMTLSKLSIHAKPIGLLNLDGFYDPLLEMFTSAVRRGFLPGRVEDYLIVDDDPARLLARLKAAFG